MEKSRTSDEFFLQPDKYFSIPNAISSHVAVTQLSPAQAGHCCAAAHSSPHLIIVVREAPLFRLYALVFLGMKNSNKLAKRSQGLLMATPVSEAESDRRLRSVLDALYLRNWKQALKLVHQALNKRPGWPAARALRACALMQNERFIEAEKEISDIRADLDDGRVPVDEDCAKKMHMYYSKMRQEGKAGDVYEQAWKADPANFQLAETAFCLYVRGRAFSSAQKVATKLHRLASAKTQKYGMWATTALWLGLSTTQMESLEPSALSDSRMLKLACAMLSKAIDSLPITPSAEMVRFAVRVFKDGGELQRARDLISNRRLVMDEAEVLHIRSELSLLNEKRLEDHCKALTAYDADDWAHWLGYFECIPSQENWDVLAGSFIEDAIVVQKQAARPKRGPFLAKLELLLRREQMQALAEEAVEYFKLFAEKTVSAHDLRPYVLALVETEFFEYFFDAIGNVHRSEGDAYRLSISWLRLWFDQLGEGPEQLFQYSQQLMVKNNEPTDRQPGDDFLLLAAHKLLPVSQVPGKERYHNGSAVLQAILILEAGLAFSPCNFHFKLLLIRLYIEVGALSRIFELWQSLEVKHVQLSTLTHIVLHPFFDFGHHESSQELLDSIAGLWRECDQEISECISKAFHDGSINAAMDFVFFRSRLERSMVLAECMAIDALHELASSGGEPLGIKRALMSLTTMPRFTADTLVTATKLVNNTDSRCFSFWDTNKYEPNDHWHYRSEIDIDEGAPCSYAEIGTIAADLDSLQTLLNMAVMGDSADQQVNAEGHVGKKDTKYSEMVSEDELPACTTMRVRIADNLTQVHQLLLLRSVPSSNGGSQSQPASSSDVLNCARKIAQDLVSMVSEIIGIGTKLENGKHDCHYGANEGKGCEANFDLSNMPDGDFSPSRLQKCGRLVFDSLLVTSVALLSFGPCLTKAKRRAKKCSGKEDAKSQLIVKDVECGRGAVLEYKQAVLLSCSLVQNWIAACLEKDLDWASTTLPHGEDVASLLPFLPDLIPSPKVSDEVEDGIALTRSEFCNGILANICSSHAKSCKSILKTLRGITSQLKMVDL